MLQEIPGIVQLAEEKGVSIYCLVLGWLRAKSPCVLPIPGATKVSSIADSLGAADVRLTAEEVRQIDRATSGYRNRVS
jgi:aryl-alcohol dehydrogenase-like predicted oxidoreductase